MNISKENEADIARTGVSDISGAKDPEKAPPEELSREITRVAGGENVEKSRFDAKEEREESTPSGTASAAEEDGEATEREFEALIKGRFRDVYRKRTEKIVRKRLASLKGRDKVTGVSPVAPARRATDVGDGYRSEGEDEMSNGISAAFGGTVPFCPIPDESHLGAGAAVPTGRRSLSDAAAERAANRIRPRENGVGGSVGMVTGINVDALTGKDVLSLISRVSAGEKITFAHFGNFRK